MSHKNQLFTNNAVSTLAAGITDTATSLTVPTGHGALFPAPASATSQFFFITISDGVNLEICRVYGRTGDTFSNVNRAQDGTTARAWTSGAVVELRVTAETLANFAQGFDNVTGSPGTNAVNLQPSRAAADQYASGANAIAVGKSSKASSLDSIAVGNGAAATADAAVAIGPSATNSGITGAVVVGASASNTGSAAVVVGNAASSTQSSAVAVGGIAAVTGVHGMALGYQASAGADSAMALGRAARAHGASDVVVGREAMAANSTAQYPTTVYPLRALNTSYALGAVVLVLEGSDLLLYKAIQAGTSASSNTTFGARYVTDNTVTWKYLAYMGSTNITPSKRTAVGNAAAAGAESSTALGVLAVAGNIGAVAIGDHASAADAGSIAIGSKAYAAPKSSASSIAIGNGASAAHSFSMALGYGSETRHNYALSICNAFPSSASVPDWGFGSEHLTHPGLRGVWLSESVDLAGGATWQASTSYSHGRVVRPSTPNGHQYVRYDYAYPFDHEGLAYTPSTSSGTEPTWPTTAFASVVDGNGEWICVDNSSYVAGPFPAKFAVERIGIICYEFDTVTVAPSVSFGTSGSPTLFVNNQACSNLTAAYKIQSWDISASEAVDDLRLKIDTLATGTKLLCRFFVEGFYVKHWL